MNVKNTTWSNIDFEEFKRNYDVLKECADNGMHVMGLTNANAYTYEPLKGCPMRGMCPPFLAVSTLGDGLLLREKGVTFPILVREYPYPEDASDYVKALHGGFLAQSADSLPAVRALQQKVMFFGGLIRLHLKVEMSSTGSGFHYLNEDDPIDDLLSAMSVGIYCEGIYTELKEDEPTEVKDMKIQAFTRLVSRLEEAKGRTFAIKHYFSV